MPPSFPFLLFTLLGGVIADRVSKRHLLIAAQTAQMILAFVLAGLTYFKIITIDQLALIAFLVGISNAREMPLRTRRWCRGWFLRRTCRMRLR